MRGLTFPRRPTGGVAGTLPQRRAAVERSIPRLRA